jgi:lipocalin
MSLKNNQPVNTFLLILFIGFLSCSNSKNTNMNIIDNAPVRNFNVNRYLGTWYEIARFPHSFEKGLTGVTATYSLRDDGKIRVVNAGYKDSLQGKFRSIEGKAKLAESENTGHLKVSFFLFFYANYYVLELDTVNYEYALVGSSSPDYLWILCRRPYMPEETYNMLVEKAKEKGYAVHKLIRVEQKPLRKYEEGKTI